MPNISKEICTFVADNPDERSFYEIECTQQQWSVRQLSRQVGSSGVFTLSARQRLTTA